MHGGIITKDIRLEQCSCGHVPEIVWHYITGVANHVNYFAKCNNCKTRTRDRKSIEGAIQDWNKNGN